MPEITNSRAEIVTNSPFSNGSFLLVFRSADIAFSAYPGQFVYIKASDSASPILRRAFSIMNTIPENGLVELFIDVKGSGTIGLSKLKKGDFIDVVGPLGNGFRPSMYADINVLVGGGCGIAPLIMLAKDIIKSGKGVKFFYGGRSGQHVVLLDKIKKVTDHITVSTDDGSFGVKGVITELVDLKKGESLFSCGPKPMLKALADMYSEAFFAMETEMACGVGVCMGCAVPMVGGGYKRCCTEGPVFRAGEVLWS